MYRCRMLLASPLGEFLEQKVEREQEECAQGQEMQRAAVQEEEGKAALHQTRIQSLPPALLAAGATDAQAAGPDNALWTRTDAATSPSST